MTISSTNRKAGPYSGNGLSTVFPFAFKVFTPDDLRVTSADALGVVRGGDPYPFDMGGGFCPFRRDVDWLPLAEAPIRPLLGQLAFTRGGNWGYQLRFGLFEISADDMDRIAEAMASALPLAA